MGKKDVGKPLMRSGPALTSAGARRRLGYGDERRPEATLVLGTDKDVHF
jgi:hypothetical protein